MKLTKFMREQFVDDVMGGIPVEHRFDIEDAKSEIRSAIEMKLPVDLYRISREYPNLFTRSKSVYLTQFKYTNHYGYESELSVRVIDHENCAEIDVRPWVFKKELADAELNERDVLRKRLTEIANACTTLAKLKVALPELESYMPVEEVKRNLPVASGTVITDLLQLGLKIPK